MTNAEAGARNLYQSYRRQSGNWHSLEASHRRPESSDPCRSRPPFTPKRGYKIFTVSDSKEIYRPIRENLLIDSHTQQHHPPHPPLRGCYCQSHLWYLCEWGSYTRTLSYKLIIRSACYNPFRDNFAFLYLHGSSPPGGGCTCVVINAGDVPMHEIRVWHTYQG